VAGTVYFLSPNTTASPTLLGNTVVASGTESNFVVMPSACTVTALNLGANNYFTTSADTSTVVVYKNSLPTLMTCSVVTNGNGASCSDTTHTFAVNGGDTLSLAYSESDTTPFVKLTSTLICQ
jgi:hypothetical protein